MDYVIKIKYENILRRLTLPKSQSTDDELTFARLEGRIRELFQLPANTKLVVSYTDIEEDVVTMANDEDVRDALKQQLLNPLRLFVTLADSKNGPANADKSTRVDGVDGLKQVLEKMSVATASQFPGMLQALLSHLTTTVNTIAEATAAAAASGVGMPPSKAPQAAGPGTFNPGPFEPESSGRRGPFRRGERFMGQHGPTWAPPFFPSSNVPHWTQDTDAKGVEKEDAGAQSASQPQSSRSPDVPVAEKQDGSAGNVHHYGVTCDGCGMNPIVGLRWKSNKKYDYDLCTGCYEKHGPSDDYNKIAQPVFRSRHFHGPQRAMRMTPTGPSSSPMGIQFHRGGPFHVGRPFGVRGPFAGGRYQCGQMGGGFGGGKLDARFVCDITMFDGTQVAPGSHFTKIWRLRNSGTLPWPAHTNLVHVGGDDLGHVPVVPLEIPEQGLAPEEEMNVSVDLVAPEKPGRYVSHWRLASPAGPKFGHRIWVLIQVVSKEVLDQPADAETVGLDHTDLERDLKCAYGEEEEELKYLEEDHVGEMQLTEELISRFVGLVENGGRKVEGSEAEGKVPTVEKEAEGHAPAAENDGPAPVSDVLGEEFSMVDVSASVSELPAQIEEKAAGSSHVTAGSADETAALTETFPVEEGPITYPVVEGHGDVKGPITYPLIDAAPVNVVVQNVAQPPAAVVPGAEGESSMPKSLLLKLEAMGFSDSKLNGELLEKNNMDLRKTLDDLCAAEEWDRILEELQEMGFYDTEMNRRLMFKNNGSVKRVVKELVQMYRGPEFDGKKE